MLSSIGNLHFTCSSLDTSSFNIHFSVKLRKENGYRGKQCKNINNKSFFISCHVHVATICRHQDKVCNINGKSQSHSLELVKDIEVEVSKSKYENEKMLLDLQALVVLVNSYVDSRKWSLLQKLAKDPRVPLLSKKLGTVSKIMHNSVKSRKFKVVEAWLDGLEIVGNEKIVSVYNILMRVYLKLGMYEKSFEVFRTVDSKGWVLDIESYCILMSCYKKRREWGMTIRVFEEMVGKGVKPNVVAYGILIDALGKQGKPQDALRVAREMQKQGIEADEIVYNSLIHAFSIAKMFDEAHQLVVEVQCQAKDPVLFATTVQMYVDSGRLSRALGVVRVMKEKGIVISDCLFCKVVNGCCKVKGIKKATKVFEELVSLGLEPGQLTYGAMVNVYTRLGMYATAERLLSKMQGSGIRKCVVVYSNLIHAYGKIGNTDAALRVFHAMREARCSPNIWVYNSLIQMYGRKRNLVKVEQLLCEMKGMSILPDNVSYTSVISSYIRVGLVDKGIGMFHEYKNAGGKVDCVMAGIMVNAFTKSNRLAELFEFLQDLHSARLNLDLRLHRSALNAFLDAGMHKHAQWFIKLAFWIDGGCGIITLVDECTFFLSKKRLLGYSPK